MIEHQSHLLDHLLFQEKYCRRHTREKYPNLQKQLPDFGMQAAEAITQKISAGITTVLAKQHRDL